MAHILLIEDNDLIIKGLKYFLLQHEFNVDVAKNIFEATKLISNKYDLIILDLMFPDGNGLDFYQNYVNGRVATIILSAKDEESQVVECLDAGVDDYIIKPFRSNELLSRINKIIRKNQKNNLISIANIQIDTSSSQVYVDKKEVQFTSLEYKILVLLFENAGIIISRDLIIDKIYDISGNYVNDNTITVYIKRIREKLGNPRIIKTIKGLGYRVDK